MSIHEDLRLLREAAGSDVLNDVELFRAAFDDYFHTATATPGELNLLADAIRLGAAARSQNMIGIGANAAAAVESEGARLAQLRGTREADGAMWALAVIGYARGDVPADVVTVFTERMHQHPPDNSTLGPASAEGAGAVATEPGPGTPAGPRTQPAPTGWAAPPDTPSRGRSKPSTTAWVVAGVVGLAFAAATMFVLVVQLNDRGNADNAADPSITGSITDAASPATTSSSGVTDGTTDMPADIAPEIPANPPTWDRDIYGFTREIQDLRRWLTEYVGQVVILDFDAVYTEPQQRGVDFFLDGPAPLGIVTFSDETAQWESDENGLWACSICQGLELQMEDVKFDDSDVLLVPEADRFTIQGTFLVKEVSGGDDGLWNAKIRGLRDR